MWDELTIHELVEQQRRYFRSGATLDVGERIQALRPSLSWRI